MSTTYFSGTTTADATHPAVTITATSNDDMYTIFKKALDLEFYPTVEVAAEELPPRAGALPEDYILISMNRLETEYSNGVSFFLCGYFDVIIVTHTLTALEGYDRRIRNALVSRNFCETGNSGVMQTEDEYAVGYRSEYLFRKEY